MLSPALLPFCISSSAQRESHSSALCKSFVVLKKTLPGESSKFPGSHTAKRSVEDRGVGRGSRGGEWVLLHFCLWEMQSVTLRGDLCARPWNSLEINPNGNWNGGEGGDSLPSVVTNNFGGRSGIQLTDLGHNQRVFLFTWEGAASRDAARHRAGSVEYLAVGTPSGAPK